MYNTSLRPLEYPSWGCSKGRQKRKHNSWGPSIFTHTHMRSQVWQLHDLVIISACIQLFAHLPLSAQGGLSVLQVAAVVCKKKWKKVGLYRFCWHCCFRKTRIEKTKVPLVASSSSIAAQCKCSKTKSTFSLPAKLFIYH